MTRIILSLLSALVGYVAFAVAGYLATLSFSSNMHDRELEAAMTGAFVSGPIGVLVGATVGAWWSRPARPNTSTHTPGRAGSPGRSPDPER